MKKHILFLLITILLTSCIMPGQSAEIETEPEPEKESQKLCGDGVCDGPENAQNCSEDCPPKGQPVKVGAQEEEQENKDDQSENAEKQETDQKQTLPDATGKYRKVAISGTIQTHLNTATIGDFTGDAFEYSGEYSFEIWFPAEGGQPVKQRNSIRLTEMKDLYFGDSDCRPCTWELDESAYTPYEFELQAELNLEEYLQEGQPADELLIQLTDIPSRTITGVVDCPCPGSEDTFSDPAAFPVLMTYFMQKLSYVLEIQSISNSNSSDFPASPMYTVDIPEEVRSYIFVNDLEN